MELEKLMRWAGQRGLLSIVARIGFVLVSLQVYVVILFFILMAAFLLVPWPLEIKGDRVTSEGLFAMVIVCIGLLAFPTLHAIRLITQRLEQRPLASIGLRIDSHSLREFFGGLVLGVIFASIGFALLFWNTTIRVSNFVDWTPELMGWVLLSALGWLGVAFWEELFFRGYLLQTLASKTGLVLAILISSLAFGAVHIFTYGLHLLVLLDIAVVGIILSILYLKTKSLWAPMGMHFANNFWLSHILAIPLEKDIQLPLYFTVGDRPVYLEVPHLLFQTEMVGGKSLLELYRWEDFSLSLPVYVLLALLIWKLPWFRAHSEMEALWQQHVPIAQPWTQLKAWWARRKNPAQDQTPPPSSAS